MDVDAQRFDDAAGSHHDFLSAWYPTSSLASSPTILLDLFFAEEELVPTVFRWEHGGRQVYITGTFNNWEKQV